MNDISLIEEFLSKLTHLLPVFFVALIAGETIYLLLRFRKISRKETAVNVITGIVTIVVQALLKTFFLTGLYPAVYEHRIWDIGWDTTAWILGFFIYTFLQFATHYFYHKIRLFWCLHEVHHSAIHMNTTTGLRTSVFDIVSLDIFYLLIPLIGIHPLVYFVLYTLNKFWGAFIHVSDTIISRIPFLEQVLVTPSTHHLHHARNIPYLDKNYGEIIPWFDRLFGTYAKKEEEPVYGTLTVQRELDFWETQLHEFKSLWKDVRDAKKWNHKLCYIFMPPGWHPGNKSGTAKELQKRYRREFKLNDLSS
jgi:sterol desaturase/sphingolipid hydroxylase (fatty acid hydroxylase superfamily)